MKQFIWIAILLTYSLIANANSISVEERIAIAKTLLYEGGILEDKETILRGYKQLTAIYQTHPTPQVLYFIAQAKYELVRLGVSDKANVQYLQYLDQAINRVEELLQQKPTWSEVYALKSMLQGLRIIYNPISAVTAGPKSYYAAEEAVKLDSTNPRAWMARGIVRYHMPTVFGGSVRTAIECFKKSIALFERSNSQQPLEPSWGYLDALLWLGWAYQQQNEFDKAADLYRKALSREPRAMFIKNYFLPILEKKQRE